MAAGMKRKGGKRGKKAWRSIDTSEARHCWRGLSTTYARLQHFLIHVVLILHVSGDRHARRAVSAAEVGPQL